jgi:hypothetical protein
MPGMRRLLMLTSVVGIVVFGATAVAMADEFCVGTSGGTCTQASADLQAALNAAYANDGDDTVRLGAGTFTAASHSGFNYQFPSGTQGNVAIVGAGQGQTTVTAPPSPDDAFYVNELLHLDGTGTGSTVSDLTVALPTPTPPDIQQSQYRGVAFYGPGGASRVTVAAPAVKSNAYGFWTGLSGMDPVTITDSTVTLPTNLGISNVAVLADGPTTIDHADLTADTGVLARIAGLTDTIRQSTIRPGQTGVSVNNGTANVRSSVIELTAPSSTGAAFNGAAAGFAETPTGNLENVTIAGSANGLRGLFANVSDAGAADAATVNLNSSIITGVATTISRNAGNSDPANITTAYSNYDAALNFDNGGPGTLTESNRTNVAPGFVNAAGGNFHLMAGSPLIDAGDPAAPAPGSLDLDGDPRAVSFPGPGCGAPAPASRRDIGADEFVDFPSIPMVGCPTPSVHTKKCKKGQKRKHGKCVKKKRKKRKKR